MSSKFQENSFAKKQLIIYSYNLCHFIILGNYVKLCHKFQVLLMQKLGHTPLCGTFILVAFILGLLEHWVVFGQLRN